MTKIKKISIVIPAYNEESTISKIIERVLKSNTLGIKKELIIVDDGSIDNTKINIKKFSSKNIILLEHKKNLGKGAALRTGFKKSTGDIILIQDADSEYHPDDFPKLLKPIINGKSKIVYGSRELSGKNKHSSLMFHAGGRLVTFITNLLYGSKLTDEATGYKIFDAKILKKLPLKCKGFEFCPEVTALLLKRGEKILEVPIKYTARHKQQGKKIKTKDGIIAVWTLLRIWLNKEK